MKAVIMAGGKGSRLRPLTCHLPKPMVPLLDRPCMEYIIELLKRYGVTEIAVTVQYLPQVIKNHFGDGSDYGVQLHYFDETTPLGTAGSVKNAEDFLDETFLVISGDALTDFNLRQALAFHKEKQAIGTLVLTRVDVPLEYGVVMTEADGRIARFLEKPSWSEVFSDTVNTGIYVLEPEILSFFKQGIEFDFSKDLFPLVMNLGLPLYGYVAEGYWSDIGNLVQYRQTQFDMLNGLVDVSIKGREIQPKVWVNEGVSLHQEVRLEGPAFIGHNTEIKTGAQVGPFVIIGRNSRVEPGVFIDRTVIWHGSYIGRAAGLSGTTLCSGNQIGAGVLLHEDTVVGEKSWIGDLAVIQRGVKVWPGKSIGAGTVQSSSLIWGKSVSRSLFGAEGIGGVPNYELSPEMVGRITAAYVSCLPRAAAVSVSCAEDPYCQILKYSVISSMLANGVQVQDIGSVLPPVARYECRRTYCHGGVHIRRTDSSDEASVLLQFFDQQGLPIDKGMERKIENALLQEDFSRPTTKELGQLVQLPSSTNPYLDEIRSQVDGVAIQNRRFAVVMQCEHRGVRRILLRLLESLGCSAISVENGPTSLEQIVMDNNADLGVQLDASAQKIRLYTETGYLLTEAELLVLQTLVSSKAQELIAVPVTAPTIVEEMQELTGKSIVRTKNGIRSLLEVGSLRTLQLHDDGIYTLAAILDHLAKEDTTLQRVLEIIPPFHMNTEVVSCPLDVKGRVMRRLMEEMKGNMLELIDGIKVRMDDGWALILPDSEKASFKIVAQGASPSKALELTELYKTKIALFQKEA